jgi:hypothetical protein
MKHFFGAVILSALIGTACSEDSNRTDRIVVLDSWWSLDHAKTSCEQATQWYRGSLTISSNWDAMRSRHAGKHAQGGRVRLVDGA